MHQRARTTVPFADDDAIAVELSDTGKLHMLMGSHAPNAWAEPGSDDRTCSEDVTDGTMT